MAVISVSARRTGGPLACELTFGTGHVITTDEPEELGGGNSAPTPQQLLAGALASCVATTIQMYLARKEWELDDWYVDVDYDAEAKPPRFEVIVVLPEDLDDDRRARVMRIAGKCPVHRALMGGVEVVDREG